MLEVRPISLKDANEFVKKYHRHDIRTVCWKFAISVCDEEGIHGVAICRRPINQKNDDGLTLEIYKLCTDGTFDVDSMLYNSCCRIGTDMGYKKIILY